VVAVARPRRPRPHLAPAAGRRLPSEIVAHSDPTELVARLRERYTTNVLLLGGPSTIATLLDLGMVDRLDVLIVPVLFGTGIPLAQDPRARRELRLEAHHVYGDGTAELSYSLA
jgi:riboflavin biosynthesis pyrimidine reductase